VSLQIYDVRIVKRNINTEIVFQLLPVLFSPYGECALVPVLFYVCMLMVSIIRHV